MGCLAGAVFNPVPAVDRAKSLDLLGLRPGPRVEERVVVADHHVARRVPELCRDELRVAAADECARDVAAAQCLLSVALARAHLRALQHPLPAPVAPVVVVERPPGPVGEEPALRAADVAERALAAKEIRQGTAGGDRPARTRLRRLDAAAAGHGALYMDQTAALGDIRPAQARALSPAQAGQQQQLRQWKPHPLGGVPRAT